MALNDDADKLRVAEDYLLRYRASSQEFEAALEHVRWLHDNKAELRPACEQVLRNVVVRRHDEAYTMAKLGALK